MAASRQRSRRRAPGLVVLLFLVGVLGAGPARAGPPLPPTEPDGTVSLETVLDGSGEVRGAARTDPTSAGLDVVLLVENPTATPVDLVIEPGTLLASEEAGEQTTVLSAPHDHPDYASAPSGDDYVVTLEPGETRVALAGYCAEELDTGSHGRLHHVGMAADPLPQVMRNIAASEPDPWAAQEAVWWVTDDPVSPVHSTDVGTLLEGVDTASFAAAPHRVVPGSYTPIWAGGEQRPLVPDTPFDTDPGSGDGAGLTWLVALGVLAGMIALMVRLGSRRGASVAPVGSVQGWGRGWTAGWYPDPWNAGGLRWWDGEAWSAYTTDPD